MDKKVFDLNLHRQKVMEKFKAELGEPTTPSWEAQIENWNKRKDILGPRNFIYVYDLKEDKTILSSGLSAIGYQDDQVLTSFDLIGMVHENHRLLFSCQVYRIHEVLMEFNYSEIGMNYYSGGFRAIKDKSGKYWLTYYTSEAFQYDSNGVQVRHLTWVHILSPYRGEPLYLEFFHRDGRINHKPLKRINKKLRNIKLEQLQWLGFGRDERELITHYHFGTSKEIICELLEISERTLENRNRKILKIGRKSFPINDFKTCMHVVKYLEKIDLIP